MDLLSIQFNKKVEIWKSLNQKEDSVQKIIFFVKNCLSKRYEAHSEKRVEEQDIQFRSDCKTFSITFAFLMILHSKLQDIKTEPFIALSPSCPDVQRRIRQMSWVMLVRMKKEAIKG